MTTQTEQQLGKEGIHHVLSNERRRRALQLLKREREPIDLRRLVEEIAEKESGESPPPTDVRRSVYCSLHQTHLPRLHRHDIVDYDDDRKEVTLKPEARKVNIYMDVFGPYGITWSTFYRWTGVLGMLLIVADQMAVFGIAGDYSILIASVFLLGVVLSRMYQLWSDNWIQVRGVLSR